MTWKHRKIDTNKKKSTHRWRNEKHQWTWQNTHNAALERGKSYKKDRNSTYGRPTTGSADTQHVMFAVDTATLTLVTEVVVGTDNALEAVAAHWFLTSVTLDLGV